MARYEAEFSKRLNYKRQKLAGWTPRNNDKVSIISFPHKLNIVMEGWQGLRMRLEYYAPLKKGFVLQLKGPNSLPRHM